MKCNNCMHQEICALFDIQGVSVESPCSFYKDKNKFIELPCKVGDTIYVIPSETNYKLNVVNGYKENNRIYAQTVEEIRFFKNNIYLLSTCNGLQSVHSKFYKINWFLTIEEAKQALKEREECGK